MRRRGVKSPTEKRAGGRVSWSGVTREFSVSELYTVESVPVRNRRIFLSTNTVRSEFERANKTAVWLSY